MTVMMVSIVVVVMMMGIYYNKKNIERRNQTVNSLQKMPADRPGDK